MKKSLLLALSVMIMTVCAAKEPKVLITYFSASGTTKSLSQDLASYDVVYIGFPIWGDAAPNIIYTFIEKNDLKGKTVIIFSTSGSSNLTNSFNKLKEQYPDLTLVEGTTLKRNPTPEARQEVINKLKEAIPAK